MPKHVETQCWVSKTVRQQIPGRLAAFNSKTLTTKTVQMIVQISARIFGYLQNQVPDRVLKRVPGYPFGNYFAAANIVRYKALCGSRRPAVSHQSHCSLLREHCANLFFCSVTEGLRLLLHRLCTRYNIAWLHSPQTPSAFWTLLSLRNWSAMYRWRSSELSDPSAKCFHACSRDGSLAEHTRCSRWWSTACGTLKIWRHGVCVFTFHVFP